jgi:hypothetical protein
MKIFNFDLANLSRKRSASALSYLSACLDIYSWQENGDKYEFIISHDYGCAPEYLIKKSEFNDYLNRWNRNDAPGQLIINNIVIDKEIQSVPCLQSWQRDDIRNIINYALEHGYDVNVVHSDLQECVLKIKDGRAYMLVSISVEKNTYHLSIEGEGNDDFTKYVDVDHDDLAHDICSKLDVYTVAMNTYFDKLASALEQLKREIAYI